MIISAAKRTAEVQEYYFSRKLKEIESLNQERRALGQEPIISLGIGAPDRMPPADAIKELQNCAALAGSHAYQSYVGTPQLREAFARWYQRYYGVSLNASSEIQPLVGSKEGILLICLAFLNEGDKVLIPDPGYPTYTSACKLAGAQIINYDLEEQLGWQPDFDKLEQLDLSGVKIMWTNYPNMPTGGRADMQFYSRLVDFALRNKILIVNDNPYSFILNNEPLSILSVPGAKACCLELNSLSKAHNMSGWRIGMLAGDSSMIKEVLKVKSQMDSGMFRPLQMAAVKALEQGPEWFSELNDEYRRRQKVAGEIFSLLGIGFRSDSAGLFLWGRVPEQHPLLWDDPSASLGQRLSDTLLYKAGVFITPGFIFGKNGRDYVRISLCADTATLEKAKQKICELL